MATCLVSLVLGAASASAAETYIQTGAFGNTGPGQPYEAGGNGEGSGSGDGEFINAGRAVVQNSTGYLFVVDSGNDRIQVFKPTATSGEYLTQLGAGFLDRPTGIAIDQSTQSIYVADAGNDRILRYTNNGGTTPTFTVDGSFPSPKLGNGEGEVGNFDAGLAVDATSGDLLVADSGNNLIQRYGADGKFKESFDGEDSPGGKFTNLLDIAVSPTGEIFAVDSTGNLSELTFGTASSRVERFNAGGGWQETLGPVQTPTNVSVAPATGDIFVAGGIDTSYSSGYPLVTKFTPSGATWGDFRVIASVFSRASGAAVTSQGRLYVVTDVDAAEDGVGYGGPSVRVFRTATTPTVTIDTPSQVTYGGATLTGTVDSGGEPTTWKFEISSDGGINWSEALPAGEVASGSDGVEVSVDDLQPLHEYRVRLVAKSEAGSSTSNEVSFSTPAVAPAVLTMGAAPRTETAARINGYVNPRNSATTYHFEFGPDASYGTRVPSGKDLSAGQENASRVVSQQLTGLQPDTTYHFRLVAESAAGKTEGEDQTFSTRSPSEPRPRQRSIEMVSAPEKGNQTARAYAVDETGEKVVWTTNGATPQSTLGANGSLLSVRSDSAWNSKSILPPVNQLIGQGEPKYLLFKASADLSTFLFNTISGILDTTENSYFVRIQAGGEQEILHASPPEKVLLNPPLATSSDLDRVYLGSEESIDDAPSGIYDISAEPAEVVSRLPNGTPALCDATLGVATETENLHYASDDGTVVFFQAANSCGGPSQLYRRDMSTEETELITGPALDGPDLGGTFIRASDSGDEVVFVTASKLVPNDALETSDIYRWTQGSGQVCLTCGVSNAAVRRAYASPDLSRIYFDSVERLIPGVGRASEGDRRNLYVWSDGEVRFVAPTNLNGTDLPPSSSTSGSLFVFSSADPEVTADSAGGHTQIYVYDANNHSVECISCGPSGSSAGDASSAATIVGSVVVADDGQSLPFITPTALVREDINGVDDIYEWRNGHVKLVTDGETEWPTGVGYLDLAGMSENGRSIVFSVAGELTGYERDGAKSIYVAREGGGLPPPPRLPQVCKEDDCQGPLESVPSFSQPGSVSANGPGNSRGRNGKLRKCRAAHAKREKRAGRARCTARGKSKKTHGKAGRNGRGQK